MKTSTNESTDELVLPRSKMRRGFRFALIGLICGFIGIGIGTYRMSVAAEEPVRPRTKEISDVLAETIKKTADKLRNQRTVEKVEWTQTKKLGLAASIFGFLGAAFGCASWLVGEHRRWTWAALCVGLAAMAWTHVVVAVAIAVGLAIFIIIVSHM